MWDRATFDPFFSKNGQIQGQFLGPKESTFPPIEFFHMLKQNTLVLYV